MDELASLTEQIRIVTIADLLAIVRALREIRKTLVANDSVTLLMEDDYRKEKFEEAFEKCLAELWHIVQAVEKPKPRQERPALPVKPPERNLWS